MKRRELLLSVVAGVGVAVGKLPEGYAASQFVKEIAKDADFDAEVLKSQVPVLVFFTATWSGPSKAMAPIIDRIGQDYQGKVKVVSVDIDNCTETPKKYGIRSVPAYLAFKGGQKVGSLSGPTTRENLLRMMGL